jgi:uncharacterized repeat protein (TIGR01451 family)
MREMIGRSTRRLAIIGIPLALLLALVVVLGVWADDEAPAVVSGGNLVQYQIVLGDAEGGRFEILLPDGFEYVGLAAGSEVAVEPDVSRGGRHVVWNGPFPGAPEARFWVYSTTVVDVPPRLHVDGAGVEAERVEPLRGLLVEDDAEAPTDAEPVPDVDAEATPEQDAEAEPTPDVDAVATTDAEPTPDVDAEPTADAEPAADAKETAEAEPTPDVDAEATGEAEPTPDVDVEATADAEAAGEAEPTPDVDAEPTADAEATAEAKPTPTADPEPTVDAEPTAEAEPTLTAEPEAEPTPEIEEVTPVEVQVATVSVDKSVEPGALEPGDHRWVTYIVTFTNDGGGIATLDWITDTLPSGFLFGGMAIFSEVGEPVDPGAPEAVWEGVTVPDGGTRTLRYYAKAPSRAGDYQNSVVAQVGTALVGPKTAPLYVEGGALFLPSIIRKYPEGVPLPYEENFDVHPPANWEPFTNFPGLDASRWFAAGGVYNYQWNLFEPVYTYWDLSMFNAPGTELWTNYRIEARIKDSKESNFRRGLSGIWFRASAESSGAMDGESVGGYYLMMRPFSSNPSEMDRLFLYRIPADDPAFDAASVVDRYHYEKGIGRKKWYDVVIEVRGNHIQVWFGRPEDGGLVKAIDWYDTYPADPYPYASGTVGFVTYATTARFDYIRVLPLP